MRLTAHADVTGANSMAGPSQETTASGTCPEETKVSKSIVPNIIASTTKVVAPTATAANQIMSRGLSDRLVTGLTGQWAAIAMIQNVSPFVARRTQ
jgi:hypothetical protein